jgi:gamma-glutamyltranspeptidase/glutathione hydrolase
MAIICPNCHRQFDVTLFEFGQRVLCDCGVAFNPFEEEPEPVEIPIDGVLDLHTFRPFEVKDLVQEYLRACQAKGIYRVRIVHGKGTGALMRTVHSVLKKTPEVESFQLARPEEGGWGATIVLLRIGENSVGEKSFRRGKKKSPKSRRRILAMGAIVLGIPIVLAAFANPEGAESRQLASGEHGMAASAHPLATQAGIDTLKKGGSAFDAAVAVAAALNVVEPMMSGMGGYGTILIYDAAKENIRFLNSSGRIPKSVNSDVFRKPDPDFEKNRRGAKAVSTPGNVHAWEALSKDYGRLEWKDLFIPAITAAEDGFVLDQSSAEMIQSAYDEFPPQARAIYGRGGKPLAAGEKLVQKDLARSLRQIAQDGASVFYQGEIGRAIDAEMHRSGGFLSLEDLKSDRAEWWDPIHVRYRGFDVYTASPPSTAFCSLIRLGLMSCFDVAALGHNTAPMLHRFIEATKHAFWCRLRYAGDPQVSPPPLDRLLSEGYWKEQAALIDPTKARPFRYPGEEKDADGQTTHFVVADRWGNIVSATQTLGNLFGSRTMPPGTGIWLNDSLAYCTFEPKGNPMDAHAGRRKLSGDCPTIILKQGKPWAALGTPGGHTIGQTVPQMAMNLIDFRMDIAAALAAPRVSFIEPDTIAVEEDVGQVVIKALESLGHKIRILRHPGGLGNAHGLTVEFGADGRPAKFNGAADPRGRGRAQGY